MVLCLIFRGYCPEEGFLLTKKKAYQVFFFRFLLGSRKASVGLRHNRPHENQEAQAALAMFKDLREEGRDGEGCSLPPINVILGQRLDQFSISSFDLKSILGTFAFLKFLPISLPAVQ